MAEVLPIRPLDETAALDWLRSQPGGRTNLPAAELGRRWGWPRHRAGRRIKAWARDGIVRRRGKTIAVAETTRQGATRQYETNSNQRLDDASELRDPDVPLVAAQSAAFATGSVAPRSHASRHTIDVLAYAAAIALAGAAAWFSIRGMVVLFPGSPLSVIGMSIAMEGAKLVTAGWLARRWRSTAWVWRLVLVVLVAGLAVINATGVYAQLVAAHVGERGAATSAIETQTAALDSRIAVQQHTVDDLDRRVRQMDSAVEEAAKRGKINVSLSAMEGQRKARAALVDERKREAATLATLQTERATVVARGRQVEVESAPIRYVAEMLGSDADSEKAIRWLIALMVLCCDPLAIALTAAASARR
jgi:hypothetical protein